MGLVTIRLTTKRDPCIFVIYPIRKCPTMSVSVGRVFVIPPYKSFAESYWTTTFLVNAILAWKRCSDFIYHETRQLKIWHTSFMFMIPSSSWLCNSKLVRKAKLYWIVMKISSRETRKNKHMVREEKEVVRWWPILHNQRTGVGSWVFTAGDLSSWSEITQGMAK